MIKPGANIYKQRDILLVPFPFSDQKGKKVRPVLVMSNDKFNDSSEDLIVCGITSNILKDFYTFKIENKDLEEKKIKEECCVKVENVLKIDNKLIIKKIDKINEKCFSKVLDKFHSIFKL